MAGRHFLEQRKSGCAGLVGKNLPDASHPATSPHVSGWAPYLYVDQLLRTA